MRRVLATGVLACLALLAGWHGGGRAASDSTPALAYYYIWFDATSWERSKRDYPLLGRYSSDEQRVMQEHVRWAKAAGIDGFIVSWKSSWRLNRRLELLLDVAAREQFKLALIYQGLDFEREPLPVDRIAADLDLFVERYAAHPAFDLFDKPVVIWSGSWRFSTAELAKVTGPRRDRLLILASEKDLAGYRRAAPYVDGDAYYWSSVDPARWPGYWHKLVGMGRAVHARSGLWIAPAAPGFDARLVGGSSVVRRRDGDTLRQRLDGAVKSAPDALGIISWNEFSENTHIEPSEVYGDRYLEVVSDALGATFRSNAELDSSDPGGARCTTARTSARS